MRPRLLRTAAAMMMLSAAALFACSSSEPTAPPQPSYAQFATVYTSWNHTCAITLAGDTYCWGSNKYGQLGEAPGAGNCAGTAGTYIAPKPFPCDSVPHRITGAPPFVLVATGIMHSCGLTASGEAWCWGGNLRGQLGFSDTSARDCTDYLGGPMSCKTTPTLVANNTGVSLTSLAVSGQVNMSVGSDGRGYAWGDGAPFRGDENMALQQVLGGPLISKFTTGTGGVCALYSTFWSCIDAGANQLGAPLRGDPGFVQIVSGADHMCGLTATGAAYCWGFGVWGQLGLGSVRPEYQYTPAAVIGGHQFVAIAPGQDFTCAIDAAARVYCWGGGFPGTSQTDPGTPRIRDSTTAFTQIAAGFHFFCGISTSHLLYCLGDNSNGALGDGTVAPVRLTAVHVKVLAP